MYHSTVTFPVINWSKSFILAKTPDVFGRSFFSEMHFTNSKITFSTYQGVNNFYQKYHQTNASHIAHYRIPNITQERACPSDKQHWRHAASTAHLRNSRN
jgi:hypothetical protein